MFLGAGEWLPIVQAQLQDIDNYPASKSRNSNLAANAPALAVGNPMTKVVVPTMAALVSLCDAYSDADSPSVPLTAMPLVPKVRLELPPLNQILFGPPGTGKTFATINAALEILAPEFLAANQEDRSSLKLRFDELTAAGHIRFVTFHQSFSYEDFVEGLRAQTDKDGQLRYEVVDGVFKSLCDAATAKITVLAEAPIDLANRHIWKMSLGNTAGSDSYIFDECIDNGYALLGYGKAVNFAGAQNRDEVVRRFEESGHKVDKDDYAVTAVNTFLLALHGIEWVI